MASHEEVTLSGELPTGAFTPTPATPDGDWLSVPLYRFDRVTAHDVEFVMDEVMYLISGSEFDNCVFRQNPRITKVNRQRYFYSYGNGSLGHEQRSIYRNCTFDRVDFGDRGGGYRSGDVRFEGCTFNRCDFREFTGFHADFVDCTFVGAVNNARFCGPEPPPDAGIRSNVFSGNDLSQAKLGKVEFRYGIDLRACRLPVGPEYLRIDQFPEKAHRALGVIAGWPDEERTAAESALRTALEFGGSGPVLFMRHNKTMYGTAMARLQALLESV
jgi:hypothetical protein